MTRYLTANEATKILNISKATLYAYVSRGLVRSEPAGTRQRHKRYHAEDIEKLKRRQDQRRNPSKVVEQALHFGAPVLESAISLIDGERLFYRGRDVIELVENYTFEEVVGLIWTGALGEGVLETPRPGHILTVPTNLPPLNRFITALAQTLATDLSAHDLRPAGVIETGARILKLLVQVAGGDPAGQTIPDQLQQGWMGYPDSHAANLIRTALILMADHELNVSSFTARCVASAGSTPYNVVMAGLNALQGHKHGGHSARVSALFREVTTPDQAMPVLASRLQRGDRIPGFGHPLYPGGDPRGRYLLEQLFAHERPKTADAPLPSSVPRPPSPIHLSTAIVNTAQQLVNEHPTVDLALITLTQVLGLPDSYALTLFALSRTVGWIGHALEQYTTNQLIRPRARYTGKLPE